MHAGNRVIIDRCNMDPTQRSHWTKLANQHWPHREEGWIPTIWVLEFCTSPQVCIDRLKLMTDHPTIKPGDFEKVVHIQKSTYVEPSLDEGLSCIIKIHDKGSPLYNWLIKEKFAHPWSVPGLKVLSSASSQTSKVSSTV